MKIEIKNAPTSEIDWSKDKQLVQSITGSTIVLTSNTSILTGEIVVFPGIFSGIDLVSMSYSDSWKKSNFKPFNGEITLKND